MFARGTRLKSGLAGICFLAVGSFVSPSAAHSGKHITAGVYVLRQSGPWTSVSIYANGPNQGGKAVATRGAKVTVMQLDCVVEEFYPGSAGHITYARGRTNTGAIWYFQVQVTINSSMIQITDVQDGGLPCGYSSISSPNRSILEGVGVVVGRGS